MRDPSARVIFEASKVIRTLVNPIAEGSFLRSELAASWVASGRMASFEVESPSRVSSARLPFVSYPAEWCASQLYSAGQLTLDLQQEAVQRGFDLKDASAWNILFDGSRPVFCDLLSAEPLTSKPWWAAGQFTRHFLLPLVLAHHGRLRTNECFRIWRDGVPPGSARGLIGWRRWATRHWPLMAEGGGSTGKESTTIVSNPSEAAAYRGNLHNGLAWMLAGAAPARLRKRGTRTTWADYVSRRDHYSDGALAMKRQCVSEWLMQARPAWTLDLGCNTGEFSRMAMGLGSRVIAVDGDHDAIEDLFLQSERGSGIHPLLASLDDLPGGRGWGGVEFPPLHQRLAGLCDAALMLALIHHLAVGAAVPLLEIARFAASVSRTWLIVEWIDPQDPQMQLLCSQRRRTAGEFARDAQRSAFVQTGWQVLQEVPLPGSTRTLALLRKASAGSAT